MDSKADLELKFPDRKMFGEFCSALRDDDVPFKLAGFQVVVLSQNHYKNLPIRSRQFIEAHRPIQVSSISAKRRALPDRKETEALLWRFSKKH